MHPPILIAPVDPQCRMSKEEVDDLQKKLDEADDGDVIVVGVPVQVYQKIDGLWVLSEDLVELMAKPEEDKHYPAESTFVPPGAKTITDDEDD